MASAQNALSICLKCYSILIQDEYSSNKWKFVVAENFGDVSRTAHLNVTSKITMCTNLTNHVSIEYTKIKIFRRENPFGFLAKLMEKKIYYVNRWRTLLRRLNCWVSWRKRFVSIIICIETSLRFLFAYSIFIEMNLIVPQRPHLVNDYGDSCYEF